MLQLIKWILVGWFIFFGGAIIVSNAFAYTLSYTLYNASSRSVPDTLIKALPYYVSAPLAKTTNRIGSQQMLQEEFDVDPYSGPARLSGSLYFNDDCTDVGLNASGQSDHANRILKDFPQPVPSVRPGRMFADQAGWIWITELDGNRISYLKARYTPPRGRICRLQE